MKFVGSDTCAPRVHAGGGSAYIGNMDDDGVVPVLLVGVAATDREATP